MRTNAPRVSRPTEASGFMDAFASKRMQSQIETLTILLVDDDQYMRKVVRTMLAAIGVKTVLESCDGISGLEAIRTHSPDLVIVDWEMPMLDGSQFVRMVRSPGEFPMPDVPIIILTGHGDRWRVVEAARAGAHEYLLKPVSTKALRDRIVSILCNPRPAVKINDYYGPVPRQPANRRAGPRAASVALPENRPEARPEDNPAAAPEAKPQAKSHAEPHAEPTSRPAFGLRDNVVLIN